MPATSNYIEHKYGRYAITFRSSHDGVPVKVMLGTKGPDTRITFQSGPKGLEILHQGVEVKARMSKSGNRLVARGPDKGRLYARFVPKFFNTHR